MHERDIYDADIADTGFDEGDAARLRPIHREKLPDVITGGVLVDRSRIRERGIKFKENFMPPTVDSGLLAHAEVAVFENGETSWIEEKVAEVESNGGMGWIKPHHASAMLKILKLPLEIAFLQLAAAYLRDTLDSGIDRRNHNVFDPMCPSRYPRLRNEAQANPQAFREFQTAINNNKVACIGLPDFSRR